MIFASPWQSPVHNRLVTAVRSVLKPWGNLEDRFIDILARRQNRRVRTHFAGRPPGTVLLIMPRCVKQTGCGVDVQNSLELCQECWVCPLGDVARLCHRYRVQALVAFRSHIAFAIARNEKPDLIIANACHDRLVKALRSVPEIPALLAPLSGMERSCVNAGVDFVWLEQQLSLATGLPVGDPGRSSTSGSAFSHGCPRPTPSTGQVGEGP